jgi:hypothetical protein
MTAPCDYELLADLVSDVEAGLTPSQAALEEAVLLVEERAPAALRYLERRMALRRLDELRRELPGIGLRGLAALVGQERGHHPDTLRRWLADVG